MALFQILLIYLYFFVIELNYSTWIKNEDYNCLELREKGDENERFSGLQSQI